MPKTREQNQTIKDERKEAIIKSATVLFAFKSYKNVTIDDITNQTKCSHGLFYHYYNSKEDLFHDIMKYSISQISKLIKEPDVNSTPDSQLSSLIQSFLDILKNTDDYLAHVLYMLLNLRLQEDSIPKPRSKNPDGKKPINRHIYDLIMSGQEIGCFIEGNPREYTVCLMATLKGLAYNRIYVGADKFICPNVNTIMNMVRKQK